MSIRAVAIAFILALSLASASAQATPFLYLKVFPDGYASASINESVVQFVPVNVTLVGAPEGLTVAYSNGTPALYSFSNGVVTIEPAFNGTVTVSYYVTSIIFKNNVSWFVNFTTPYPTMLQLPQGAKLTYINRVPQSISISNNTLYLTLSPGSWDIGYIIPPPKPSVSEAGAAFSLIASLAVYFIAIIAVAFASVFYYRYRKKKSYEAELERDIDVQIVEFLKKKGGKAKESEIRQALVLPKTSAWRAIKRLERKGIVRVEKVGKENLVILII